MRKDGRLIEPRPTLVVAGIEFGNGSSFSTVLYLFKLLIRKGL